MPAWAGSSSSTSPHDQIAKSPGATPGALSLRRRIQAGGTVSRRIAMLGGMLRRIGSARDQGLADRRTGRSLRPFLRCRRSEAHAKRDWRIATPGDPYDHFSGAADRKRTGRGSGGPPHRAIPRTMILVPRVGLADVQDDHHAREHVIQVVAVEHPQAGIIGNPVVVPGVKRLDNRGVLHGPAVRSRGEPE